MKKKLLSYFCVMCMAGSVSAQSDTLTEFFTGTPILYSVGAANGGGYVNGTNGYNDKMKLMKYDSLTGLNSAGTVEGVLLAIPVKVDGGGSFEVNAYSFVNDSTLGTQLASETITIASVDTALSAFAAAEGNVIYNVAVTFSTPFFVNADEAFTIGVVLPQAAGDTIAILGNSDGDFQASQTNTFEVWSDDTFINYVDSWGIGIALSMYPVFTPTSASIEENDEIVVAVSPNPTTEMLTFDFDGDVQIIEIYSLNGTLVKRTTEKEINVADLANGTYVYNVLTSAGRVSNGNFVKK